MIRLQCGLKKQWNLKEFHNEAKTEKFCEGHYKRHHRNDGQLQQLATQRARELHLQYENRKDYANHCPCTTVYQLVEELNKNLKS